MTDNSGTPPAPDLAALEDEVELAMRRCALTGGQGDWRIAEPAVNWIAARRAARAAGWRQVWVRADSPDQSFWTLVQMKAVPEHDLPERFQAVRVIVPRIRTDDLGPPRATPEEAEADARASGLPSWRKE